ncbi:MAG: tetratricopeptide repeat protein [Candidatus Cloacimonadota bacterium]|nr:MAG: tetratricopeptide repeat protein [Candidatus Cloacimonadota bacterium]
MVKLTLIVFICLILAGCPDFPRIGPASVERAWTYYDEGEYDKAIKEFDDVIEDEPDNGEAYNGLGWCYGKLGELTSAVDDFNIALEKADTLIDPYAGLTFVYSDIPQDQDCVDAATTLIQRDPLYFFGHDNDIDVDDVRLVKAKSLCNLGNFTSALVEVKILNPSFNCDVSTPEGREALLAEIERLRGIV